MIRLKRSFSPLCLPPSTTQRLTDEYKRTGKAVWNFAELKSALLLTSNGKCAYCECRLSEEGKYVEVEHFLDKDRHPDNVVSWENILPSCKRCNGAKGTHDTTADPILNPYVNNPRDHLQLRLYRLRGVSHLGETTLGVLNLNDPERMVKVRFEVGEAIQEAVLTALVKLDRFRSSPTARNKNSLTTQVRGLLRECQEDAAYAATCATVLHNDPDYERLKREMDGLGLWYEELEELHQASLTHVLGGTA